MTASLLKPSRYTELDSCNLWVTADDNTPSAETLETIDNALGTLCGDLDLYISALPDVTDSHATDPTFGSASFTLLLPDGPAKFTLHASIPRKVSRTSVELELRLAMAEIRRSHAVQALTA